MATQLRHDAASPASSGVIEEARREVRRLASEISQLARQDLPAEDFYLEMLRRAVAATSALGGAVWTAQPEGGFALSSHVGIEAAGLTLDEASLHSRLPLLNRTMSARDGWIVPPRSGDARGGVNPGDCLLLLCPWEHDGRPRGVVEIFQRPDAPPAVHRSFLAFVQQVCSSVSEYHRAQSYHDLTGQQRFWEQLEAFCRRVHGSLSPQATAEAIANEAQRLLQCDRVSVAAPRGRKFQVRAISSQDQFERRSELVRLLNNVATVASRLGEPLWFTGESDRLAPQLERALQAYADVSQVRLLGVLPLRTSGAGETSRREPPQALMIVECFQDVSGRDPMQRRSEAVAAHAALAYGNACEHDAIFGLSLWKALGKTHLLFRLRTLPKTLLVAGAVAGLAGTLTFVPADFRLEAPGALQPVIRRDVFAPLDGVISAVHFEHGSPLPAGSPVEVDGQLRAPLELRNLDLEVARTSLAGEIATSLEEFNGIELSLLSDKTLTPAQIDQMRTRKRQLEESLRSLRGQMTLLDEKTRLLQVYSPIDGQVTTMDVRRRLIQLPVERGQLLFSVADPSGAWELELHVPEDRMGHVTLAAQELPPGERLPVTFMLKSEPGVEYRGEVVEIHQRTDLYENVGNAVQMKVRLDKEQLPLLREGAEVSAKIHCGRRALGYVLFHDAIAFVQAKILFRF